MNEPETPQTLKIKKSASDFRNFIFGVEDSLVSTVGLLSGVAVANTPVKTVVLAGVVLIFVEAFSMGMGSLLSENSAEEFTKKREVPLKNAVRGGAIMFFSYFASGFIPLFPYILFSREKAFFLSIFLSLVTLFILGVISGKFSKTSKIKQGITMLALGGVAIGLGISVGLLVSKL